MNENSETPPHSNISRMIAVRDYCKNGAVDQALPLLEEILSTDSSNLPAMELAAFSYARIGDYDQAIKYYKQLTISRANPEDHYNVGVILKGKNEFSQAIDSFREVIRHDQKNVQARYQIGHILLTQNRIAECVNELMEAVSIDPTCMACKLLESVLSSLLKKDQNNAHVLLSMIKMLLISGNKERSIEYINKIRTLDTDYVLSYSLGAILVEAGMYEEAIKQFQELTLRFPSETNAFWQLGRILAFQKKHEESLEPLQRAAELDPRNESVNNLLNNQRAVIRRVFTTAFEQMRDGVSGEAVKKHLLEQGFGEGLIDLKIVEARGMLSDPFVALLTTTAICQGKSLPVQAEQAVRRAIELYPNHPRILEGYFFLSNTLLQQGHFSKALEACEKILEASPGHEVAEKQKSLLLSLIAPIPEKAGKSNSGKSLRYTRLPESLDSMTDLDKAIADYVLNRIDSRAITLSADTKVVTIGSCFAANISVALRNVGINAVNLTIGEEANSTFANSAIVENVIKGDNMPKNIISTLHEPHNISMYLHTAELVIYTLGVAPCFFDKETGKFVPSKGAESVRGVASGKYIFRTTTVEENVNNLLNIIDCIRSVNEKCQFVLSLSPVPMQATLESRSIMEADCLSKSTLRVTADRVVQARDRCVYWPAFEVVRWLGAYFPGMYGKDDGAVSHVSRDAVAAIVRHFIRIFYSDAAASN
ncbi:MAG: GSCFA domain-containing protein [Magnetococcus sp. YQC-3]